MGLDDWVDAQSVRAIPGGGWSSGVRQNEEPTLRLKLAAAHRGNLALGLTDHAADIPSSNYVRRPWIEAYRNRQRVEVDFWPDLELRGGDLVQWLYLHPADDTAEIDEIMIRAQPTPYVEKEWTIRHVTICRDSWAS